MSLTRMQIHVIHILIKRGKLSSRQKRDFERTIIGLKRRQLMTPGGQLTPGAYKRFEKYLEAQEAKLAQQAQQEGNK